MPIPDFKAVVFPLLRLLQDKQEHSLKEIVGMLGSEFGLSANEMREGVSSGQQESFHNRVGRVRTYIKKAGLIEATRSGHFRITCRGLRVLAKNPIHIDLNYLDSLQRKLVEKRLSALGLLELVRSALAGNKLALNQLSCAVKSNPEARRALRLVRPSKIDRDIARMNTPTSLERAVRPNIGLRVGEDADPSGGAYRRFTVRSVRQSSSGFHPTRPHGRAVAFGSRLPSVGPAEDLLCRAP